MTKSQLIAGSADYTRSRPTRSRAISGSMRRPGLSPASSASGNGRRPPGGDATSSPKPPSATRRCWLAHAES